MGHTIIKTMKLIKYPDPLLKKECVKVEIDDELKKWLDKFLKFLQTSKELKWGNIAGLAAPQVGKNIRVFYAFGQLFINPTCLWLPKAGWEIKQEGCFSLEEGKFDYKVRRAYAITISWQDIDGEIHEQRFNGFKAQILQHELNHLDGKTCVDLNDN